MIEESIDSFQQPALNKGLKFTFEKNETGIYCNVEKKLLDRSILYIPDNSIRFTNKGSISVKIFISNYGKGF